MSPKDLFIDNLKKSYEITSGKKPQIYFLDEESKTKVKVASIDIVTYAKFGKKRLLRYEVTIHNTLRTNPSEIVAWIFLTHKEVEEIDVKYFD
jgi:hypothetical protein